MLPVGEFRRGSHPPPPMGLEAQLTEVVADGSLRDPYAVLS